MAVTVMPCTGIKPGKVSLYNRYEGIVRRKSKSPLAKQLSSNPYREAIRISGLSKKASGRLKDAIRLLIDCSDFKSVYSDKTKSWWRFKNNFVTLTLPSQQVHTDLEIHTKVFVEFIRAWKRRDNNLLYVWKAETQENGNLHYHLITNSYMHHVELRRLWNHYCNKLGYLDRSNSKDPNSTDIHAVKGSKNLIAYAIKYMSKKEEGRRVPTIRKWYCSKALLLPTPVVIEEYSYLTPDFQALEREGFKANVYDYAVCYYPNADAMLRTPTIGRVYRRFIEKVKRYNKHQTE